MKATRQYFPVMLFITLYIRWLLFLSQRMKSWSVTIQRKEVEHALISSGAVCHAMQGGFTFESVDEILKCTVWMKEYFSAVMFIMPHDLALSSVYKIRKW